MERSRWSTTTSWEELAEHATPSGGTFSYFAIGEPGAAGSPTVVKVSFPPGSRVESHTHACDYCEILLEGSETVTRTLHRAGDILIRKAGTVYGPLIAGPEGVTKLLIFTDDRVQAISPNSEPGSADQLRMDQVLSGWSEQE